MRHKNSVALIENCLFQYVNENKLIYYSIIVKCSQKYYSSWLCLWRWSSNVSTRKLHPFDDLICFQRHNPKITLFLILFQISSSDIAKWTNVIFIQLFFFRKIYLASPTSNDKNSTRGSNKLDLAIRTQIQLPYLYKFSFQLANGIRGD